MMVSTRLQAFGLIVTAEPYYSVTYPSELVVLENIIRKDTKGKVEEVDAKVELFKRAQYEDANLPPLQDGLQNSFGVLRSPKCHPYRQVSTS